MATLFISYRRSCDRQIAGRIRDRLAQRFDVDEIFRDRESIRPGESWRERLDEAIGSARVCLVVIGAGWLEAADEDGSQRLFREDDWVRFEIATALSKGVPVIPVLVEGATIPKPEKLPENVAGLTEFQGMHLSEEHWDADWSLLLERVRDLTGRTASRTRMKAILVLAGVATMLDLILAGIELEVNDAAEIGLDTHFGLWCSLFTAVFVLTGFWFLEAPGRGKLRALAALYGLAVLLDIASFAIGIRIWRGDYVGAPVEIVVDLAVLAAGAWFLLDARSMVGRQEPACHSDPDGVKVYEID